MRGGGFTQQEMTLASGAKRQNPSELVLPTVDRSHAHVHMRPGLHGKAGPEVFGQKLEHVLRLGADRPREEEHHQSRKRVSGKVGKRTGWIQRRSGNARGVVNGGTRRRSGREGLFRKGDEKKTCACPSAQHSTDRCLMQVGGSPLRRGTTTQAN